MKNLITFLIFGCDGLEFELWWLARLFCAFFSCTHGNGVMSQNNIISGRRMSPFSSWIVLNLLLWLLHCLYFQVESSIYQFLFGLTELVLVCLLVFFFVTLVSSVAQAMSILRQLKNRLQTKAPLQKLNCHMLLHLVNSVVTAFCTQCRHSL